MSHDRDREEVRELLLPYALGQLEPSQRREVQSALEQDDELQRELENIECAGARLLQGLPRVAAPFALKGRVLDAVRAGSDRPVTAPVTSIDTFRAARPRRFTLGRGVGAALVAACLVLSVVAVDLSRDLERQRARADSLAAATAKGASLPDGFDGISSRTVSTRSGLEGAHGSLVHLGGDKWILLLRNVPTPGLGKSWQVWTKDSNGLIQNVGQWVNADTTRVITLDRGDVREVMVSFEPTTRPVPVPSSEPVADVRV